MIDTATHHDQNSAAADTMTLWRCDFCRNAEFDTFEAAEEHEKRCAARPADERPIESGDDADGETAALNLLADAIEEGATSTTEPRSDVGVGAGERLVVPMEELPEDAKRRFGEGGFARYGNGNSWFPILEISPNDVEDHLTLSKWWRMFEKWTDNKGELQRLVFWYSGGSGRFALLPPTKIITYEEGDKAGICKVSKKLKEKIEKGKPLSPREHGLVEFLNDMNATKRERIENCIARARKTPLSPPTQVETDRESHAKIGAKTKAVDTSIHETSTKKSKPNDPVPTQEDPVVISPEKMQQSSTQSSTEKEGNTLHSSHASGFRERFLLSLTGGTQEHEEDPSRLHQQIYDIVLSNNAILSRLKSSIKTGSTIGPHTICVRSYFNKVKIIRSMERIKFAATPIVEEKSFDMQSLRELPTGLNFFSADFFTVEGSIDFIMFLECVQLMEKTVRTKILSSLKDHATNINALLCETESWAAGPARPIEFLGDLFDSLGDLRFTRQECILVEKWLEPNVQAFIKGLRLKEWEVEEEYDLLVDGHVDELMGVVSFVTA
ncbi:hypothetical protein ACHAW6_014138 [Cyclotella cf. meneghiniana]